jgi:hypothetical protein
MIPRRCANSQDGDSMPMCLSDSHDERNHSSMPMCPLSNSDSNSHDDRNHSSMPMCLLSNSDSNSQDDDST